MHRRSVNTTPRMTSTTPIEIRSPDEGVSGRRPGSWRMAAGLFGLSYGTALFALAMFKLLSFFIMPSLFFDMLFIGFPLGAWLGARFLAPERHFIKCLWALQAVMAGSVAACLMAKRFDYLRSHLFDIELTRLVIQVVTFVAMFLPFFAAYGLCEYLGYQVGRRNMGGRMRAVYALALFGAATAYVSLKTLLPMLGMARMLVLALARWPSRSWSWASVGRGGLRLARSSPCWPAHRGGTSTANSSRSTRGAGRNRPGTSGPIEAAGPSSRNGGGIACARSWSPPIARSITASTTTCSSGNMRHGWVFPGLPWERSRSC